MQKTSRTRLLAESAVMIALALVLNFIKFSKLPYGGETTLASMLPILLICIKNGPRWGFLTAFVYSLIQLFMSLGEVAAWGLTPTVFIICILFDYIVAYSILGVASFFGRGSRTKAICGVALAIFLRFVCHFITGITIWANWVDGFKAVMLYSLTYNGSYMLPELILSLVIMILLVQVPQIRKILGIQK